MNLDNRTNTNKKLLDRINHEKFYELEEYYGNKTIL